MFNITLLLLLIFRVIFSSNSATIEAPTQYRNHLDVSAMTTRLGTPMHAFREIVTYRKQCIHTKEVFKAAMSQNKWYD